MGGIFSKFPDEDPPEDVVKLSEDQLKDLKDSLADDTVVVATVDRDLPLYKKLRVVWNRDKVGWPAVIVQPTTAQHVAAVVKFCTRHSLEICVKTAGAHSGHALVSNCVAVDLSLMRKVTVDPEAKTVTLQGGAMIGDVDEVCKPHNLALIMGQVHHTGVAGMALNATSGIGYLTRTRGLNVQHLQAATLVLASGEILENVTEESHPDLFWGLRGAGSNYGIATELTYRLSPVPPEGVFSGDIVKFPIGEGPPIWNSGKTRHELVMNHVNHFLTGTAPTELSMLLVVAAKGPVVARVSYIPKEDDNDKTEDNLTKAKESVAPIQSFGTSLMDTVKIRNYHANLQKMAIFPSSYYYQKAGNCKGITEEAFGKLCDLAKDAPVDNKGSAILIQPLGGVLKDLKPDDLPTALSFSTMDYWIIVVVNYPQGKANPELRDKCLEWVRACFEVLKPFRVSDSAGDDNKAKQYWDDEQGNVTSGNEKRLVNLKNKYDSDNLFRHNRNVKPTTVEA